MTTKGANRIKAVLGYTAAVLALIVAVGTFMGQRYFAAKLVSATGISVSARYTGGEVRETVDHGAYTARIHRPVFDGLTGDREEGFIQVNWEPRAGLPPVIRETVRYSGGPSADFLVELDTATGGTSLTAYNPAAGPVLKTYRLDNGWAIRIALKKTYR